MAHDVESSTERWLLYDGDCGFCQRWCEWARQRGAEAAVTFLPCQDAEDVRRSAGIEPDDCRQSAFLIEQCNGTVTVHRAAAAINGVLARLPGARNFFWRLVSRIYRVPGIRHLEDLMYPIVARWRHRLSTTCQPRG